MAKEIELGLTLEGDQIRRFEEYIRNPTCTDLGIKIIRKAVLDARAGKFHDAMFEECQATSEPHAL